VLEAVKNNGFSLTYASKGLKNNYEIVIEAVKNYGMSLVYASHELQNNYEIVLEAVKNNGLSLKYASHVLKNNYEIVLEAVKNNQSSLGYVSKNFKKNYFLIYKLICFQISSKKELSWKDFENIYAMNNDLILKYNYFKCFNDDFPQYFFKFCDFDLIFIFLYKHKIQY
jgi:hypothetical protein